MSLSPHHNQAGKDQAKAVIVEALKKTGAINPDVNIDLLKGGYTALEVTLNSQTGNLREALEAIAGYYTDAHGNPQMKLFKLVSSDKRLCIKLAEEHPAEHAQGDETRYYFMQQTPPILQAIGSINVAELEIGQKTAVSAPAFVGKVIADREAVQSAPAVAVPG